MDGSVGLKLNLNLEFVHLVMFGMLCSKTMLCTTCNLSPLSTPSEQPIFRLRNDAPYIEFVPGVASRNLDMVSSEETVYVIRSIVPPPASQIRLGLGFFTIILSLAFLRHG